MGLTKVIKLVVMVLAHVMMVVKEYAMVVVLEHPVLMVVLVSASVMLVPPHGIKIEHGVVLVLPTTALAPRVVVVDVVVVLSSAAVWN